MGKRSRECYLCGEKYSYCPTCSQDKMKPTWMIEFHDENCKNIFDICTRFNMQLMSKEEAKTALEQCDLSRKESFKDYVQRDLKNIFAEDPKIKRSKKAAPTVRENAISIPVVAEIKEISEDAVVVEVDSEPTVHSKAKTKSHEVVIKKEEE